MESLFAILFLVGFLLFVVGNVISYFRREKTWNFTRTPSNMNAKEMRQGGFVDTIVDEVSSTKKKKKGKDRQEEIA